NYVDELRDWLSVANLAGLVYAAVVGRCCTHTWHCPRLMPVSAERPNTTRPATVPIGSADRYSGRGGLSVEFGRGRSGGMSCKSSSRMAWLASLESFFRRDFDFSSPADGYYVLPLCRG